MHTHAREHATEPTLYVNQTTLTPYSMYACSYTAGNWQVIKFGALLKTAKPQVKLVFLAICAVHLVAGSN